MAALTFPATLRSQCPDGSPPPCRGAAPARRPNPPLDERTWIIVPFENVTRAADIDWLREASVNLLYLDMSKWRDIRVIDDERVADLMRDVPQTRAGQALSLEAGIAVARRAGAGKLVMGDLLKVGSRTRVVAKVFDVRSGQRVRNVIQETTDPDSLMAVFGRLARGILNADPPSEAALGTVGTTRLEAYQAYLAGVRALNAFATDSARVHLERALALDSTFALAHYKLSLVIGWITASDRSQRTHADAAARLAAGLPVRERTLIAAQAQTAAGDYGRACETLGPMTRADSNDVEALYGYAECMYHDNIVIPDPPDSARGTFRGDWNASLRAFRRVLALDPTYHLAFQHIQDGLQNTARQGCLEVGGRPACGTQGENVYAAVLRRAGDSLVLEPVRISAPDGPSAYAAQQRAARQDGSRRRNLDEARRAAEEWLSAGPTEPRARIAHARALLRLGRLEEAAAAARQLSTTAMSVLESGQFVVDRAEIAVKTGNPVEAVRLLDSLRPRYDSVPGAQATIAVIDAVLGRLLALDTFIARNTAGNPAWVAAYFRTSTRATLGVPSDSLFAQEQVFAGFLARAQGPVRAASVMAGSLVWGPLQRTPEQWPVRDTTSTDPRIALVAALAAGDSARFRERLTSLDSAVAAAGDEPDHGEALLAANGWLVLGDTTRALTRLRSWRDHGWRVTPMVEQLAQGFAQTGMLWARSLLLLGDLAAGQGQRQEAADAYRRFIALWEHGDPEVQPVVARARTALAALAN
jgi:tetratricopeptide (TPR) repeat protein/TolB-like protein